MEKTKEGTIFNLNHILFSGVILYIVILGEPNQFICTGALVEPDLVVTSASCTLRMFETGVDNFELVLGDSNLNIDLPFGVQVHEISQVIVHENYRPDDSFHYEDIGNKQTCCKNVLINDISSLITSFSL